MQTGSSWEQNWLGGGPNFIIGAHHHRRGRWWSNDNSKESIPPPPPLGSAPVQFRILIKGAELCLITPTTIGSLQTLINRLISRQNTASGLHLPPVFSSGG